MRKKAAKARQAAIELALSYPEAWQDEPWEGDIVVKVRKKVFVFAGADPSDERWPVGLGLKLPVSKDEALALAGASPSGYGLGKWGWVSIPLDADPVDPELIRDWIEESYRAVAPRLWPSNWISPPTTRTEAGAEPSPHPHSTHLVGSQPEASGARCVERVHWLRRLTDSGHSALCRALRSWSCDQDTPYRGGSSAMIAKKLAATKVEPPTLAFSCAEEFEAWVADHRDDPVGLWLRIAKKGSGIESVSHAEALQVALCYGWIDGQARKGDETTWKQRFCPRRPRSVWSKRNVGYVAELTEAGRMQPEGIAEVERAKADGRWAKAYDGQAAAAVPDDLRRALDAVPAAALAFSGLTSTNRYAILYRVQDAKRAETRARRIAQFVEMLADGRTPYPQGVLGPKS